MVCEAGYDCLGQVCLGQLVVVVRDKWCRVVRGGPGLGIVNDSGILLWSGIVVVMVVSGKLIAKARGMAKGQARMQYYTEWWCNACIARWILKCRIAQLCTSQIWKRTRGYKIALMRPDGYRTLLFGCHQHVKDSVANWPAK